MKPGERIRYLRKNKKLTQKEFANKLGYSDAFVSDIERGKAEPSREFLKKMKEIFGVPSDYILYSDTSIQWKEIERKLIEKGFSKEEIEDIQPKRLLDNILEILEGGNEIIIRTLTGNINAFLKITHAIKRDYKNKSKVDG